MLVYIHLTGSWTPLDVVVLPVCECISKLVVGYAGSQVTLVIDFMQSCFNLPEKFAFMGRRSILSEVVSLYRSS